ncbi:MAG: hypothetical protein JXA19_06845 [Anaerolineales bacterium]|nr:hypothetical protein [Anaerolineales bacterium]
MSQITAKSILIDIKAALRIGHLESLESAVVQISALPEVQGNQEIGVSFLNKELFPLAEVLVAPKIDPDHLYMLSYDPLAAIRGVALAALTIRYFEVKDIDEKEIISAAHDPRKEVRELVSMAFQKYGQPPESISIVKEILSSTSPAAQECGLSLIPALIKTQPPKETFALILSAKLLDTFEVRAGLAENLIQSANEVPAELVLELLQTTLNDSVFRGHPITSPWVVKKVLSAKWAEPHQELVHQLLAIIKE